LSLPTALARLDQLRVVLDWKTSCVGPLLSELDLVQQPLVGAVEAPS